MDAALSTVEHWPAGPVRGSVIFLHGLGDTGFGFAPLAPQLDLPGVRMVFPHAPIRAVTLNQGYEMPAWYDLRTLDRVADREDEEDVVQAAGWVEALIAREESRGVPPSRVVLGGFSQGAAMALHVGLRRAAPLAGVVALSGYLVLEDRLEREAGSRSAPVWFGHGTRDDVVPYAWGRHAHDRARALGFAATWGEWPMAHEVCADELRQLRAFLAQRLA